MADKQLTGEDSFKLINRMIYEARGYFYESGAVSIIYGISIFISCVLAWLFEKGMIGFPFHPLFLMAPVFFIQGWVQYKEEKHKKVKTFTDEAVGYVWTGYFLSVFAALCGNFVDAGFIIISIILLITAFASFVAGMLTKFWYHIVCGLICMLIAILSFFIQNANSYLLLAAIGLMVWLVPGLIFRVHFIKRQNDGIC